MERRGTFLKSESRAKPVREEKTSRFLFSHSENDHIRLNSEHTACPVTVLGGSKKVARYLLLAGQTFNMEGMKMETKEAWNKVDEPKKHPELANTPGYEMEELREAVAPVYWFLLMMEQPQFSPKDEWWRSLYPNTWLPWTKLLAAQPQFVDRVSWENVSRLELMKLGYLAPAIFKRRFPHGRPWDLYAFLTPREKECLLRDLPQLKIKWTGRNWMRNGGSGIGWSCWHISRSLKNILTGAGLRRSRHPIGRSPEKTTIVRLSLRS